VAYSRRLLSLGCGAGRRAARHYEGRYEQSCQYRQLPITSARQRLSLIFRTLN
jgi:hypothetical protein